MTNRTTKEDAPTLLPCPFCGSRGKLITCSGKRMRNGPPWYETRRRVVCSSSSCSVATRPSDTENGAVEHWNTRADAPELLALVKSYREMLDFTDWVGTGSWQDGEMEKAIYIATLAAYEAVIALDAKKGPLNPAGKEATK